MDVAAPAGRWGWQLNAIQNDVAGLLAPSSGATGARTGRAGRDSRLQRRRALCSHVPWPELLAPVAVAIVALEFIRPAAYRAPALHATIESVITVLALLSAMLFRTHFEHSRRLRDLMLFGGLLTFTVVELTSSGLAALLGAHAGARSGAMMLTGSLFAAAWIAAAALTPSTKLVAWRRRPIGIVVALSLAALALAALCGLVAHGELVVVTTRPLIGIGQAVRHPAALFVVILTAGLLAVAAGGFAHRSRIELDGALSLLAGGAVMVTAARVYFLALPWASSQWITSRQGLCLVALALVFAAALRQELDMRARLVRAAAMAERRRLARDLHDSLAQDLAFIVAHGPRMAAELGAEHPVAVAAQRALAISRGAIDDFSDLHATPPREALEAIAADFRDRFGMAIAVDADVGAGLPTDSGEHILRIAREAIANAGRHGAAKNVIVSLTQTSRGLALRVRDDGRGIRGGGGSTPAEGFGMTSMRERAASLGGQMTVRERSTGGTELEVLLP
jgi:signal transduction histidine kinase